MDRYTCGICTAILASTTSIEGLFVDGLVFSFITPDTLSHFLATKIIDMSFSEFDILTEALLRVGSVTFNGRYV